MGLFFKEKHNKIVYNRNCYMHIEKSEKDASLSVVDLNRCEIKCLFNERYSSI